MFVWLEPVNVKQQYPKIFVGVLPGENDVISTSHHQPNSLLAHFATKHYTLLENSVDLIRLVVVHNRLLCGLNEIRFFVLN